MDASQPTGMELFGLFELDTAGTVLYHRNEPVEDLLTESQSIAGQNFYDDVAAFENTEEFRRCVTQFTLSAKFADSFDFDCRYDGNGQPVRVLLARIGETGNPDNTKSILVHIRRVA
jgi:hypothetical protein